MNTNTIIKMMQIGVMAICGAYVSDACAQQRDCPLTVTVTDPTGESLEGKSILLVADAYALEYPAAETMLDASGRCNIMLYAGPHTLTVDVKGRNKVVEKFESTSTSEINIVLQEAVTAPYGLNTDLSHDIMTGENTLTFSWNGEDAIFFDDFESYAPFTIDPQPWTTIDVDQAAPAILQGDYANRGMLNGGQIIAPLSVDPIWDLAQYWTLAPYSGKQYAGFVVRADGKPLDDWMVAPSVHLTDDCVVRLRAKGADKANGRIAIGITESADPRPSDFEIISEGNFISLAYDKWVDVCVDLAEWAGRDVRIGVHCTSPDGSFVTMFDDFFIGKLPADAASRTKRVRPSAANPLERFEVYLDGTLVETTDGYSHTFENFPTGTHTLGVRAVYHSVQSDMVEKEIVIDPSDYAALTLQAVSNRNDLPLPAAITIKGVNQDYTLQVESFPLTIRSLKKGHYELWARADAHDLWHAPVQFADDMTVNIDFAETLVKPYNITATQTIGETGVDVALQWNTDLGFFDSFEDYADFATGEFGGWTTLDFNQNASYPIALGGQTNIVHFPGCSTPEAQAIVPPLVFNPYSTRPSMESDPAILAPHGLKSIAFFSPQRDTADKWLISPPIRIREEFEWNTLAKAYSIYPERLEFCLSEGGADPADFQVLKTVDPDNANWEVVTVDLAQWEGKEVRLGVHYVSNDAMICQIDYFWVGRSDGQTAENVGNVQEYIVSLDDVEQGRPTVNSYTLAGLGEGVYDVKIQARYVSGLSAEGHYDLRIGTGGVATVSSQPLQMLYGRGVLQIATSQTPAEVYTLSGVCVCSVEAQSRTSIALHPGVYIVKCGDKRYRIIL